MNFSIYKNTQGLKLRKSCGERNKENARDHKPGACIVYVCMYVLNYRTEYEGYHIQIRVGYWL